MLGQFTLGIAIVTPILMFANMQLRGVLATDSKNQFLFDQYFRLRLLSTAAALAMILAIAMAVYSPKMAILVGLIAIGKCADAITDIYYGLFQNHERLNLVAKPLVLNGLLSTLGMAVGLRWGGVLFWGVFGWSLASFLTLLQVAIARHRTAGISQNTLEAKEELGIRSLIWVAFPLGMVSALITLNASVPRFFIQHETGEGELGIFAALSYIVVAGNTIVMALVLAASPRLARLWADGDSKSFVRLLARLLTGTAIGTLLATIVALYLSEPAIRLVYGNAYAGDHRILVWLVVGAGVSCLASFVGCGITSQRAFAVQLPLTLLTVVTSVVSCWILVPQFGLFGAAYSVVISATVQLLTSVLLLGKLLRDAEKSEARLTRSSIVATTVLDGVPQ